MIIFAVFLDTLSSIIQLKMLTGNLLTFILFPEIFFVGELFSLILKDNPLSWMSVSFHSYDYFSF